MPADSNPPPPVPPDEVPTLSREGDLEFDFDSRSPVTFNRSTPLPVQRAAKHAPAAHAAAPPLPPGGEAAEADSLPPAAPPRWGRFERKSGEGTKAFTRFVIRPETSVAATLATDRSPSERTISVGTGVTVPYQKIRDLHEIEFRPSRLQHVMNDTWTHARLAWIDQLGRLRSVLAGTLLAVLAGVVLWPYAKEVLRKRETTPGTATTSAEVLPSDPARQAAIRRAFDAYRAAPDFTAKLPWVIEAQRVESRMKDFYVSRGEQDPPVASYEVSSPIRAGASWWFTLTCLAPDGTTSLAIMKETPGGGHLDWENFVSYGSIPWDRFAKLRPGDAQAMRVLCRPTTPMHPAYPAETHLACEIAHRSGAPVLTGYALKTSRSGQMLASETGLEAWKPLTVYLHWETPAAGPPAVIMGDLIRNNWLDALRAPTLSVLTGDKAPTPAILPSLKP